ncbi:unnamed protein product [Zymoseptoria tritici ST99CH_1A5]|uniref:Folic acid synthesis protein FOL1 n=1 Tax=Zymoseptoria tritici ST99CH_1A5 TaxID=1276529 RepID=A0A1Y6LN52_ZYMTR|nr:unnamed protein product [Zymoseptoria tritici ST99CH_1A5]
MYSTSKFAIPNTMSKHFGGAAVKLYTHGSAQDSWQATIASLRKPFNSDSDIQLLAASSPLHAFGCLARIAVCVLKDRDNARNAFVQLFSRMSPLSLERRATFSKTALPGWTVYCAISKSSDGLRSRPWISLETNKILLSKPTTVRSSTKANTRTGSALPFRSADTDFGLVWAIGGELKPAAFDGVSPALEGSERLQHGSVFRSITDGLNLAISRATKQYSSWTSCDSMMLDVQRALLEHLKLSPLPSVLDLAQLNIDLIRDFPRGRRYVRRIRLNSDGTVRKSSDGDEGSDLKMLPVLESHSAIEPDIERPKMLSTLEANSAIKLTPDFNASGSWLGWKDKTLSDEASAKLGVDTFWKARALKSSKSNVDNEFAIFDAACQRSDSKGLECFLTAARPSIYLRSAAIPLPDSGESTTRAYRISLTPRPAGVRFTMNLPRIYISALAIAGAKSRLPIDVELRAFVSSNQASESTANAKTMALIPEEVTYIVGAAEVVIESISKATAFDDAVSAASALAEALLRVLAFRSPSLSLGYAYVSIAPRQPHGARAMARWAAEQTFEDRVRSGDANVYIHASANTAPVADASDIEFAPEHEADEQTLEEKDATVPFRVIEPDGEISVHRDPPSQDNDPAESLEKDPSHAGEVAGSALDATSQGRDEQSAATRSEPGDAHLHISRGSVCSNISLDESIRRVSDFRHARLIILWDSKDAPDSDRLSPADIKHLAAAEISRIDSFTLGKFRDALHRIGNLLPGRPGVDAHLVAESSIPSCPKISTSRLMVRLRFDRQKKSARLRMTGAIRRLEDQQRALWVNARAAFGFSSQPFLQFLSVAHGERVLVKTWEAAFEHVLRPIVERGNWDDLPALATECHREWDRYKATTTSELPNNAWRIKLSAVDMRKEGNENDQQHSAEDFENEDEEHKDALEHEGPFDELSEERQHPQGDFADHQDCPGRARPVEELDTSSAAHSHAPAHDATSTTAHEGSRGSEEHDAQREEDYGNCAEYHLKRLATSDTVKSRLEVGQIVDGAEVVAGVSWKLSEPPFTHQLGFADLREMVEKELRCIRPFTFNSLGHALRRLGEVLPSEPFVEVYLTPLLKKACGSGTNSDPSRLDMKFRFSNTLPGRVKADMRDIVRSQSGAQRGKTTITIETVGMSLSPDIMSDAQGIEKLTNFWDLAFQNVIRPIATATDCDIRGLTALRTEVRLGLEKYINTSVLNKVRCRRIRARWDPDDTSQEDRKIVEDEGRKEPHWRRNVFLALGSNVGDRFRNIEDACDKLDDAQDIRIIDTSPLYETEPMYVEDQDRFLNGVCQIETTLAPMDLLDRLQAIENDLGRVKFIDKGPRNIDLDIIAYDQEIINNERLVVPHLLMTEREFVLRPLCDLSSGRSWHHPATRLTATKHLNKLPRSKIPMSSVTPLAPLCESLRALDPHRRTHVMSILNITPDSFSDGGVHALSDISALKATILSHVAAGATIIDIGGQSSRPNAPDVTEEEEMNRILPAIEAIKSLPEAAHIAISVDTYRASVAEAAVNAGAHIINDISAGLLDPDMLSTIARLKCIYIMMHMRGTPATMQSQVNTTYMGQVNHKVRRELVERLQAAREAGIRCWKIILDPGIGFAKTAEQNVELLRDFKQLRNNAMVRTVPWLVGSSRKGFIGQITGTKVAADRVGGTAATVVQAVAGGADIVRVHDVETMTQVVRMSDAMYRGMEQQQEKKEKTASVQSGKGDGSSETETKTAAAELMFNADEATSETRPQADAVELPNADDEAAHEAESQFREAGLQSYEKTASDDPESNRTIQAESVHEPTPDEASADLQPNENEPLAELPSKTESAELRTVQDEAISDQESKHEEVKFPLGESESIDAIVSKIQGDERQTADNETAAEQELSDESSSFQGATEAATNETESTNAAAELSSTREDVVDKEESKKDDANLQTTENESVDDADSGYESAEDSSTENDRADHADLKDESAQLESTQDEAASPSSEDKAALDAQVQPADSELLEEVQPRDEEAEVQPARKDSVNEANAKDQDQK